MTPVKPSAAGDPPPLVVTVLSKSFADSAGVCQLKQARELASPAPSPVPVYRCCFHARFNAFSLCSSLCIANPPLGRLRPCCEIERLDVQLPVT